MIALWYQFVKWLLYAQIAFLINNYIVVQHEQSNNFQMGLEISMFIVDSTLEIWNQNRNILYTHLQSTRLQ